MKVIKIDLPTDLKSAEIHILADLHIGDKFCNMEAIKSKINYIKDTSNAYCLLLGDLMNNATKTSVSDCYAEQLTPMEQVETCVDLLSPIKDKLICMNSGNHEKRTLRNDGIDVSKIVAMQLGIVDKYSPASSFIFLRVGKNNFNRPVCYMIYCSHGSGGGSTEGAKMNKLVKMANIIDADIYVCGHTHQPAGLRNGFYRASPANSSVAKIDKLFVNSSATLEFGGYGEEGGFKPTSIVCPVIYLSGTEKIFYAKV